MKGIGGWAFYIGLILAVVIAIIGQMQLDGILCARYPGIDSRFV